MKSPHKSSWSQTPPSKTRDRVHDMFRPQTCLSDDATSIWKKKKKKKNRKDDVTDIKLPFSHLPFHTSIPFPLAVDKCRECAEISVPFCE